MSGKWGALLKTKTLWAGIAIIATALGSYFADENAAEAVKLGGRGLVDIVLALVGAGIITQRSAIAKLSAQVADLATRIEQARKDAGQA